VVYMSSAAARIAHSYGVLGAERHGIASVVSLHPNTSEVSLMKRNRKKINKRRLAREIVKILRRHSVVRSRKKYHRPSERRKKWEHILSL